MFLPVKLFYFTKIVEGEYFRGANAKEVARGQSMNLIMANNYSYLSITFKAVQIGFQCLKAAHSLINFNIKVNEQQITVNETDCSGVEWLNNNM